MTKLLSDSNTYEKLKKDPTAKYIGGVIGGVTVGTVHLVYNTTLLASAILSFGWTKNDLLVLMGLW